MAKPRIFFLFFSLLLAWGLVILRAAQLQILPDSRLAQLARRQYRTQIDLPARRGIIVDRNGKELAVTVPSYSLYADPKEIRSPRRFAWLLARHLGYSAKTIFEKIHDRDRRFVWLARHLRKDFVSSLTRLHLRGLGSVEESYRVYPDNGLLSQVLGFVGEDGSGLSGLELQYDHMLKGQGRKFILERDARGRPLLGDGKIFTDAPAGFDVHLTVDAELQFKLEQELMAAVRMHDADGAMGIVLDARNSDILAIATVPTFDLNRASQVTPGLWRDRVITDAFEPGSTIKSLVIAKALEAGITRPNSRYFCDNGRMKVDDRIIHEADHPFGWLTTSEILMKSSNIGAAKIAFSMGQDRVRQALQDFGVGSRLGVDLPGESPGILQRLPWRKHLLANIAFGQGVTTTPLQVAAAYAAIANGGILRSPRIVSELVNEETGETKTFETRDIRRVLTPDVASTMRLMLTMVTSKQGTGYDARVPGYPVAGKTGTAQKDVPGKGYVKGEYISSFAGFLPANDPRFVIYVAVDNPRHEYYGAQVAAPLFARVASFAVQRAALPPVLLTDNSILKRPKDLPGPPEQSIERIRAMTKVLDAEQQNRTPDFTGLTLRDLLNDVRGTPIHVLIHGHGTVSMTYPAAGAELPKDKRVYVYLEEK